MNSDDERLFAAAGVRVILIEDFSHQAALINDLDLLLVADDLTSEELEQVVCDYLPTVLCAQS